MVRSTVARAIAAALLLSPFAAAQNASLTVVHGIPGLPAAVDVFANGNKAFSFKYGDSKALSLPAATYKFEVKLQGKTVLSASPALAAGKSYTAVAHLQEKTGIKLSLFVNDVSKLDRGQSRVTVRHLAKAPAVDVLVRRVWFGRTATLVKNLSNPNEATAEVRSSYYYVWLNAAGTNKRAFGPVRLSLESQVWYGVYAIGELGSRSFRLFVQTSRTGDAPALVGLVRGKSCGGEIGISTKSPEFGKAFDVTLRGGAKDGLGLFHIGSSDSRFLFLRLPLRLDILGLRGCSLYQNTPIIRGVRLDKDGKASQKITLPASMSRSFREIHFQYSFFAPGKNRLGLLLTDYASVEKK